MGEMDLDEYLKTNVKSFDLIGFRGREFVSKLIIHMEKKAINKKERIHIDPKISHIGIVIEGNDILEFQESFSESTHHTIETGKVYVFESTATGRIIDRVRDVFGKYSFGAQIRDLKDVITGYNGNIFHSQKLFKVTRNQIKDFVLFIEEYNYRPYEKSCRSMFGNFCRCLVSHENTESVFCSELVTLALMNCGILNENINPEMVVPLDFYPDPNNEGKTLDLDGEIPLIFDNPVLLK